MWVLIALLATAQATDPGNASTWATAETRASQLYLAGWWTTFLAKGTKLGARVTEEPQVLLGGTIAQKAGMGVMLTAAMRERRAINEQGGTVTARRGVIGWTMLGVSGAIDLASPQIAAELEQLGTREQVAFGLELTGIGTTLCGYVLAVAQHRRNLMASPQRQAHQAHWTLRPVASGPFTGGELSGQF